MYKEIIVNAETKETIERNYTKAETDAHNAEMQLQQAQAEAAQQAALDLAALKASAKAKLIAGQPLTAAEADTLVI